MADLNHVTLVCESTLDFKECTRQLITALDDDLRRLSHRIPKSVEAAFGAEVRWAFKLADNPDLHPEGLIFEPAAKISVRDLRELFFRLSPEPIVLSYATFDDQGLPNEALIESLGSSLLRKQMSFRDIRMVGAREKDRVFEYLSPEKIPASLSSHIYPVIRGTLASSLLQYWNLLWIHPLADGNGRVARAILQMNLYRLYGPVAIFLPITPLARVYAPELIGSVIQTHDNATVDPVVQALTRLLILACECAKEEWSELS
jgi:hypothetical protein